LFIPSLWFHNVLTYEPCVAVNVFWKHLEDDLYEKKDLYGNKDLLPGDKALKSVDSILSSLSQLPEYYREFYARKLIASLKSSLSL
jgi:tRNA wybutosine-synthesizing protein 5